MTRASPVRAKSFVLLAAGVSIKELCERMGICLRTAYGYRTKATSDTAQAGLDELTAAQAPVAGDLSAAGGLLSSASSPQMITIFKPDLQTAQEFGRPVFHCSKNRKLLYYFSI